jgi:RNA polymerase sigma-B factor
MQYPRRGGGQCTWAAGAPQNTASDEALIELVQSLPAGSSQRAAAYEELVRRYEFVVKSCVRRYRDSPEPEEDLMQVGYLGLLKAISNFDPELGPGLAAYAQPCVSGELKRHFRDKRWQVRVQRSSQELMLAVRDIRAALTQELGRAPRDHELAEAAGLSIADLREAQQAELAFRPWYLDSPVTAEDDEATTFGDLIGSDDAAIELAVDTEALWAHWARLPERQQHILAMRFYGNMTQAEIGERLGISQMHVSRLLDAALTQLREHLTGETLRPRRPRPRRRPSAKAVIGPVAAVPAPTLRPNLPGTPRGSTGHRPAAAHPGPR